MLDKLYAFASTRPRLWLSVLALLFAIQISPWLYPSVDGCLYLKTVNDFSAAQHLGDFCCLVPPGYPVLIAPAFIFGDRPFLAVSILQWLLAVATLGGTYVWAHRLMPAAAIALTSAVAVNISLWTFYRRPIKEIATLAFLMWTANLMHRLLEKRRPSRVIVLTAAVSFLTAYLVLIRYAGMLLAVAFAVAAVLATRRSVLRPARALGMSAVICGLSASVLVSWLVFDRTHGTGGTYLQSIAGIYHGHSGETESPETESDLVENQLAAPRRPRHFTRAAMFRVNDLACLTVPGFWKGSAGSDHGLNASTSLGLIVLALAAVGWWRIVSAKLDVLAILLPLYLLLYSHWDCDQPGGRFLLPMLPIILASAGVGLFTVLRAAVSNGSQSWRIAVVATFIVAHLGQAAAYWLLIDAPRARTCEKFLPIVDRLADKIRTRSGPVAITPALELSCNGLWLDIDWKRLSILRDPPRRQVEWIVDQAGGTPFDGFSVVGIDGPVRLLRREPVANLRSAQRVGQALPHVIPGERL
jgi:hypothetical protein